MHCGLRWSHYRPKTLVSDTCDSYIFKPLHTLILRLLHVKQPSRDLSLFFCGGSPPAQDAESNDVPDAAHKPPPSGTPIPFCERQGTADIESVIAVGTAIV